jgi:alpha,alpha-trehalase
MTSFIFIFLLFLSGVHASELDSLLKEEDTDHDKKITILDKGDHRFVYKGMVVKGYYPLSNLLQELALSHDVKRERIYENPVDRISRMIREYYWDGLTRRIDPSTLSVVLPDEKIEGSENLLYIPSSDKAALKRFPHAKKFPEEFKGKHGLLYLPEPYVVPGGRFNEMYGWDSYFESIGLHIDKRDDLVLSMIKNFTYEITNYGKILNANRTYYLYRSQPPYFTSMIRLLLKGNEKPSWMNEALTAAIKEYETVWMSPERVTKTGLSRYYGKGKELPPEVEKGHFRDQHVDDVFIGHDACVRESGHDTTYRFFHDGKEACADFVTVDLNTLLYKTERDLAFLLKKFPLPGYDASSFEKKAARRKGLIRKYLWDEKSGFFFDYHVPSGKRSHYISATGLYPLTTDLISQKEADRVIAFGLKNLEAPGGLFATAKVSRESVKDPRERQWEWPNGWAPHQMMAWEGLQNFGHTQDRDRLIRKWLRMITENARDYNGTIPEKFDVLKRSHAVFAEYGNVGTNFSYITREGFGWMNASYQYGLKLLPKDQVEVLKFKMNL